MLYVFFVILLILPSFPLFYNDVCLILTFVPLGTLPIFNKAMILNYPITLINFRDDV